MRAEIVLDLTAATLGFASSVVLLVTAFRAAPLQDLLDKVEKSEPGSPGHRTAVAVGGYAKEGLAKVRVWDPRLLRLGIALLGASYLLSMLKDCVFSG